MQYPLYEYYMLSSLTLDEIVDHYVTHFYSKKHSREDVMKVLTKIKESSKIKNLCGHSATRKIAPNYVDFATTINEIIWFVFRSNMTQALGVLFAILYWDEKINSVYSLKSDEDVRDDAIKIFKKFSIYEEMSQSEFEKMTKPNHKDNNGVENWKENIPEEDKRIWENPEFQEKLIDIYADSKSEEQVKGKIAILIEQFRRKEKYETGRNAIETLAAQLNLTQEQMDNITKAEKELNLAPDISGNDEVENHLFDLAQACVSRLSREFKPLSQEGEAEALIFFSTLIVDLGEFKNEIDLDIMEDKYKLLLGDEVLYHGLDADDYLDFLNKRKDFYISQYEKIKNDLFYTPMFIYNAFYLNPGCENPGYLKDFKESPSTLLMLQAKLFELESYIADFKEELF
jgi:hypothetical protein